MPRRESQTVLDVVTYVQRHIDPTLSYRFACRVGMCGSCAMTVNGRPRWTCRTHVAKVAGGGRLEIGPLENLPVIKDLATDMQPFFEKWQQAKGVFAPSQTRADPMARIKPDSPARIAADAAIECINCGVCYAACDTRALERGLSGPGGAQPRLDAGQRRARRRQPGAPGRGRGLRRLPFLPLAPVLPGALPACAQSHRLDRRTEAAHRGGVSEGRTESMNVRLYVWQRATAALMVPLVLIHIAVIFYATRADSPPPIFSRAPAAASPGRRSMGFSSPPCRSTPRSACAMCLTEWSPLDDRRAGQLAIAFGLLLAALGLRAVAAVVL